MMRATIMIAKVYDNILGEMKKRIVFFKEGKVYDGPLFFPMEAEDMIMEVICVHYVDGTVWDIMLEAYASLKVNGMVSKDDKTLHTMLHWQHVNGFSDEMFLDCYGTKNDTEYLEKRRGITNDV